MKTRRNSGAGSRSRAAPVLLLAAVAAIALTAPAGAGPDTVAVTPPSPIIESRPPNLHATGRDGRWWAVPVPASVSSEAWTGEPALAASAPVPLAEFAGREDHTIILDPVRQRLIVFGGTELIGGTLYNDLWQLPLGGTQAWTPLFATGTPPAARRAHSAVYDATADRMIVFGGRASGQFGDLWQLSLSGTPQWSLLPTTGTPPSGRDGHSAHFDAARNRMVVFGGERPALTNQTWFLDLSVSPAAWQAVSPGGTLPAVRREHVSILDPTRDQLVVFGGFGASSTIREDVWTLSGEPSRARTRRLACGYNAGHEFPPAPGTPRHPSRRARGGHSQRPLPGPVDRIRRARG